LWARKNKKAKSTFNYNLMKNGRFPEDKMKMADKQMRSVWSIPTPAPEEKEFGKHPTQKPLALLKRIILSSTKDNDIVIDPFNGSGTTGIACKVIGNRNYIGIDISEEYLGVPLLLPTHKAKHKQGRALRYKSSRQHTKPTLRCGLSTSIPNAQAA
jgi:site-specific DNA-methyltransferase (adenine-specific)